MTNQNRIYYLCYAYFGLSLTPGYISCVAKKDLPTDQFVCKSFSSYELANKHKQIVEQISNNPNNSNTITTIVHVCKYVPLWARPWILRWKISKNLYGIKIY
jgi:hypothetical protein